MRLTSSAPLASRVAPHSRASVLTSPHWPRLGYNLTQYDPNVLKLLSTNGVLDGFPYAVYPSMIMFNKDLFDEANLPYPPQKVGDKYTLDGARSIGPGTPSEARHGIVR